MFYTSGKKKLSFIWSSPGFLILDFWFLIFFIFVRAMSHNVPAVCDGLPDKEMRSISRADKLWVERAVGTQWPRRTEPCRAERPETHTDLLCDGLAARIKALRSKDQGRQTVGGMSRGKERSDWPRRMEPWRAVRPGTHTVLLGDVKIATKRRAMDGTAATSFRYTLFYILLFCILFIIILLFNSNNYLYNTL
jgi:hypothetical protein